MNWLGRSRHGSVAKAVLGRSTAAPVIKGSVLPQKKARRVCPDAPIFWVFAESEVFAILGCTHIIEKLGNFKFSLGFGFCRELLD
jgi:hypothetical protein